MTFPFFLFAVDNTKAKNDSIKNSIKNDLKLGYTYYAKSNHKEGLALFQRAYKNSKILKDEKLEALSLFNMANLIGSEGESEQSIIYFKQVIQIADKMNLNSLKSKTLNNLGVSYFKLNAFDKALNCFQENIRISKIINKPYGASLLNIGEIYFNKKNYKEALKYYDLTMDLENKTSNRKYSMAILYYNYAQVYYQLKESKKALEYAKKSLDEAVNFNVISQKIDPANLLRNIYKEKKDFKNAIAMGDIVIAAKDSMKMMNAKEQISELKISHRLELEEQKRYYQQKEKKQKEKLENALLLEKKNRENRIQYTGIFIFIFLLFLFTAVGFTKNIPVKYIEGLMFFNFLLFFKFLFLFVDPLISPYPILNTPLFTLFVNVILGLLVIPIHAFLESKLKRLSIKKES